MSCFQRIDPTNIFTTPDQWNTSRQYDGYRFSNLRHASHQGSDVSLCDGARNYTFLERVGRAVAGVLLTLLTGFLGLFSPQIRSLFHTEHQVKIWHIYKDTDERLVLVDHSLSFQGVK